MKDVEYINPYDVKYKKEILAYEKRHGVKLSEDVDIYIVYLSVSTNHDDPWFFIASTDTRTTNHDLNKLTNSFVSRKSNDVVPSDDLFKVWVKQQRKLGYEVEAMILGIYKKDKISRREAKLDGLKIANKKFPNKKLRGGLGSRGKNRI